MLPPGLKGGFPPVEKGFGPEEVEEENDPE
jgi:hypothetical protein